MAFEEDFDFLNEDDFGVPVIWGAISSSGILDKNAQLIFSGNVISVDYAVRLKSSIFSALRYGDLLQVNGAAYSVREPMPVGDGAYMMVSLSLEPIAPVADTFITTLSGLQITTLSGIPLVAQ
jgi:hypothetical protein